MIDHRMALHRSVRHRSAVHGSARLRSHVGGTLSLSLAAAFLLATLGTAHAGAGGEDEPVGGIEVSWEGKRRVLPMAKSEVSVVIRGDLASVRLVQVFLNPQSEVVHARYVFPLPPDAAVYAMRMQSGDRLIEAEIRRKPEARAVYEAAKSRGNSAALLDQHRPDVFTQEIANLLPGEPIRVELEYAHAVRKSGWDFELRLPLVVGPRFLPDASTEADFAPDREDAGASAEPEAIAIGQWNLPASSPVAAADRSDDARVSIDVDLRAGGPIAFVESPSHPIAIDAAGDDDASRRIRLARGGTLGDRDFVLRYRLAGEQVSAGATTSSDGRDGFVSLLVEPPMHPGEQDITAREVVFVLDCSGSMAGVPLEASKRFMRRMLPRLRPGDHFRIIRFSDVASSPTETPVPATPDNIRAGIAYTDALHGEGGTEMTSGIRAALGPPVPDGALRLVVFLTDGYIGHDVEIVRLIQATRGDARLFSFGIGSSVNQFLIREMARVGRGAARIVSAVDRDADAHDAADELAARLQSPLLTDVSIDWGDAPVVDVAPDPLPDLFLGQSLRVMARYTAGGRYRIHVDGRIAGRPARIPVELDLPDPALQHGPEALGLTWARAQIEDRMTRYLDPARNRVEREGLEAEVTELGLDHRLVTQWTSFVAVARPIVNPGGRGRNADVAVPRVHGLADSAYPPGALPAGAPGSIAAPAAQALAFAPGSGFGGQAAPEPGTWFALAVLSCLTVLVFRVRRDRTRSEVPLGTHPGGRR